MKETRFPVVMLQSYVIEIFGSGEHKQPLLLKNISQKTKFHLRKLGDSFHKESKVVAEQVKALRDEYSVEIEAEDGTKKTDILKERQEEFIKKVSEIEALLVPIQHFEFTEADFLDKSTNEVVGSEGIYFNIIDKLIYEESE